MVARPMMKVALPRNVCQGARASRLDLENVG